MKPLRILVVCGSRAWSDALVSAAWCAHQVARALTGAAPYGDFAGREADVVAHGAAVGADVIADELAVALLLPRVVFDIKLGHPVTRRPSGRVERALGWERYRFPAWKPLERNAVMMRWAADRYAEGHHVGVLALTAPWSETGGTLHATERAKELDLPVAAIGRGLVPRAVWPEAVRGDGTGI